MATKTWAILLVLGTTVLMSIAQIFYKFGANKIGEIPFYFNYFIVIGLIIYILSATLLLFSLKYGELSVIYPLVGASYIWVAIFSAYFFNETFNTLKIIGIIVIIIGVIFVGIGGKYKCKQPQCTPF